jgi:iron complex outermembrane recepter protein
MALASASLALVWALTGAQAEPLAADAGVDEPVDDFGEERLVTAAVVSEPAFESFSAVAVVSREELARSPPGTLASALLEEESVFVQRLGGAFGAPVVRGLQGARVQVLMDGAPAESPFSELLRNDGLSWLDPFWVEQLEIVRSPATVLSGSSALGGVVQVIGPRPGFSARPRSRGGVRALVGTGELAVQAHGRAEIRAGRWRST